MTETAQRRSAFKHWFIQQYGSLPSERKRDAARARVLDAEQALLTARVQLQVEDAKFAAFTNALYGWNARVK